MLTGLAAPLTVALALGGAPEASFVLQGKVLDPTRAPILAARVSATTSRDQRSTPTAETDADGEFKLAPSPRQLHDQGDGPRVPRGFAGGGRAPQRRRHAGVRAQAGALWGVDHGPLSRRLQGRRDQQRHEDAHVPARRAAVGHRDHEGAHPRPADAEHRRRDALHARHPGAPGREQPRPGHHPRQQLLRRLLRERRARRRAVLPRPLQPRARRGAEGTERHDLRARRRRRRRQPRDQGGRLPALARGHRSRAARTATSASPATSTSR